MTENKQKIIVIDDDSTNILILREILQKDYDVFFATSGSDGLNVISAEAPDLILLDIHMPDINGYEVCRQLATDFQTSEIPVIFITASIDEMDEEKGLTLGAVDYIRKPFNPTIVKLRVRNHLELKRQHDLLKILSFKDGLTGIANRRYFDMMLDYEWKRCCRNGSVLTLIMADIDHFKLFNDYYGHPAGDECLKQVAKILEGALKRSTDVVARYGGEEFVCLLPDISPQHVEKFILNLQQSLTDLAIENYASPVAEHVTLSLGSVSMVPNYNGSSMDLIEAADKNLFKAKSSGRNLWVC